MHCLAVRLGCCSIRGVSSTALSSRFILVGIRGSRRSFAAESPELVAEWDARNNGERTPENTSAGSGYKAFWICPEGHAYRAEVRSRTNGTGCKTCLHMPTFEQSLAGTSPFLASEWHPTKNGTYQPRDVFAKGPYRAHWRCTAGHEWENTVANRVNNNSKCQRCQRSEAPPPGKSLADLYPMVEAPRDR